MAYLGEVLAIYEDNVPLAGTFVWDMPFRSIHSSQACQRLIDIIDMVVMVDNTEWQAVTRRNGSLNSSILR